LHERLAQSGELQAQPETIVLGAQNLACSMRSILITLLASLAVLCALFVLVSEDRGVPSDSTLMHPDRISGSRLMHAMLLRQRRSDDLTAPNKNGIITAQQALKDDGFYSGPVDGRMTQSMREAILAFQLSNHLNVSGAIDDDTARQLGLDEK